MQGASLCCSSRHSWRHCATRRDMCCLKGLSIQLCHSPPSVELLHAVAIVDVLLPCPARGEREVGGDTSLEQTIGAGRREWAIRWHVERLARGERELEAARSYELRVAWHSGRLGASGRSRRLAAACSKWRAAASSARAGAQGRVSALRMHSLVGDCHCSRGRQLLFISCTVEFDSSNCIPLLKSVL
jgi:hypothetical protein